MKFSRAIDTVTPRIWGRAGGEVLNHFIGRGLGEANKYSDKV